MQFGGDGGDNEVQYITGWMDNFMNNSNFSYTGGPDPHFSIDRLSPSIGAEILYYSEDEVGRIFSFENGTYKAISSTLIFGAIKNGDTLNIKPYLISEYFNYLLDIQTITSLKENINALLNHAYPNPFSDQIRLSYSLDEAMKVQINIFDLNGKIIRHLMDRDQQPGNHSITWDAMSDEGSPVERGFYFYTLTAGEHAGSGKIILIR